MAGDEIFKCSRQTRRDRKRERKWIFRLVAGKGKREAGAACLQDTDEELVAHVSVMSLDTTKLRDSPNQDIKRAEISKGGVRDIVKDEIRAELSSTQVSIGEIKGIILHQMIRSQSRDEEP